MADQPEGLLPPAGFFNMMRISSTEREVFLDLGQIVPGQEGVGILLGRFVTTRDHYRQMVQVMQNHLAQLDAPTPPEVTQ